MSDPNNTCFEVRVVFPMDDDWLATDERLERLAVCKSAFSGAGVGGACDMRDVGWTCNSLTEATELRKRIESTNEFRATIRECTTHEVG